MDMYWIWNFFKVWLTIEFIWHRVMNVLLRVFFFHMSLSYAWCFYQYTCTIMSIVAGLQLTNSYLRKASLTPAVFSRLTFGYMGIGTRGDTGGNTCRRYAITCSYPLPLDWLSKLVITPLPFTNFQFRKDKKKHCALGKIFRPN